jgi:hypothetical protein
VRAGAIAEGFENLVAWGQWLNDAITKTPPA